MAYKHSCQLFLILAVLLVTTASVWADSFVMTSPVASDVLSYSDGTLAIRFTVRKDLTPTSLTPEYTGITFTLTNKTDHAITVNWARSSMVLPTGLASPVIHEGVRFITARESQLPTVVPPRSTLKDSVVPTNNIMDTSSGWALRSLGLVTGSRFGLYLATEIEGIQHNYDFRFRASQITQTGGNSAFLWVTWVTLGVLAGALILALALYVQAMSLY